MTGEGRGAVEWETITIKGKIFELPDGGSIEFTDDTPVPMGDGFTCRQLTYRMDNCEILFEVRDGVPGCVSIRLWADERLLRPRDLTAIPLDDIRDQVYAFAGIGAFTPDGEEYSLGGAAARKAVNRAASRRKITPEFLGRVAEIHQATPEGGRLAAVIAAFGVSERHALRYIKQAKREGFIDE